MLQHLSIQNYALIETLDIGFSRGFTVITGETGAGKSILLGALGLLLGQRADPNVLMDKEKKCVVEGCFQLDKLGLREFFEVNDLDYEGLSILRREIIPSGRSRAFVNDTPVKLELLKKLGEFLVDIHSQHQTLMLNRTQFQLEVLDGFINRPELLHSYREVFQQFEANRHHLEQLIRKNKEAKQDEDYIRFRYNELEAAGLDVEASEELIEKEKFLSHAEEVIREIAQAHHLLSENEPSALSQVNETVNGLQRIAGFFAPAGTIRKRLEKLQIELKDIASEVELALSQINFDPAELQQVVERLDAIYRLQQKYGTQSVAGLIAVKEGLAEQLNNTQNLADEIDASSAENVKLKNIVDKLAVRLHHIRQEHAGVFRDSISRVLALLGMKDATFVVEVSKQENFTENGCDEVRFLFTANKGGRPGEISKIASGGELSRLMLAVKSLVSKENLLPTVVFDEIDAGVAGEIAGKVGKILKKMSANHQLIVISHLPQIASKADTHLLVTKQVGNGITRSEISLLDTEGRVDEIAKMMSDEKVSRSAIETAKELLKLPG
ncbi:MAG: DNA repair protein RecN [Bacteroidales bacterium]|nr:DNA repair protein RecN [Bacteroidales bacterium]